MSSMTAPKPSAGARLTAGPRWSLISSTDLGGVNKQNRLLIGKQQGRRQDQRRVIDVRATDVQQPAQRIWRGDQERIVPFLAQRVSYVGAFFSVGCARPFRAGEYALVFAALGAGRPKSHPQDCPTEAPGWPPLSRTPPGTY